MKRRIAKPATEAAKGGGPGVGPVSAYVRSRIGSLLDERRVVIWYDGEKAFGDLLGKLGLTACTVVSAVDSPLTARRDADKIYRDLDGRGDPGGTRQNLLIYVPRHRATSLEARGEDPFEGLARCGAAFGSKPAEQLVPLAQLALPDRAEEIVRLAQDARLTLALLDALPGGARYPRLHAALGTESPIEAIAAALGKEDTGSRLAAVDGAFNELAALAHAAIGLGTRDGEGWPAYRARLAAFILLGELASDRSEGLPAGLAGAAQAPGAVRQVVFDVLDRLRETEDGRDVYVRLATAVEADYHVASALGANPPLGSRDTFPCQDSVRLRAVVRASVSSDIATARALATIAESTAWSRISERRLLWTAVRQCLAFLEVAARTAGRPLSRKPRDLIAAYVAPDGYWQLDRAQRLFEQANAVGGGDDIVEPLAAFCRARYREEAGRLQAAFQNGTVAEGWPPEGYRRQTQVFDVHAAPELAVRRRVAYVLVDSLRYELGMDLADALEALGSVAVEAVTAVLPTATPFGMAALLPGADGALSVVEVRGAAMPSLGGTPLPGLSERKALLAERVGDRYADVEIEDFLGRAPKQLASLYGSKDLLVIRSRGLDSLGEGQNLSLARRIMSDIIGDLVNATRRLSSLGFPTVVFAADHGHVLVPEILPGDVVSPPAGEWLLQKRRSLLGKARASAPGSLLVDASKVGIVGDVAEIAFAEGFKMFEAGSGYFHEGLSLQECVVPVVVARPRAPEPASASRGDQVAVSYRSDRFTSNVVSLKVKLVSVVSATRVIRLEAFDGPDADARSVGSASDCDGWDERTKEITLRNGVETTVPVIVDPDFKGDQIEVRAIDPPLGVILARLALLNGRMD